MIHTTVLKVGNIISEKHLLLVEDNPDDIELTKRAFKKITIENGFEIMVAKNGKEAIELLQNNPIPHLILLDLKLPGIDGFEVMDFIRTYPPTKLIPVVVLTSSTEEKDIQRIYGLGANSYIQKPVDYKSFLEVVKTISRYWITLNEHPIFESTA